MLAELRDVIVFKDLIANAGIGEVTRILQVECDFKFVVELILFSFPPS